MGEKRNVYNVLVGQHEGRDNFEGVGKIELSIIVEQILKKMGYECIHYIYLAQDRDKRRTLVNTAMNIQAA
jgi:hypothetical protein